MLKKIFPIVEKVNLVEKKYEKLSDDDLKNKTLEFKNLVSNGKSLDELIPDAFANVREAAKRSLGQRHYDVQILGGMVLHNGMIAEMKTGEGKTLVSTLAAYLNSLKNNSDSLISLVNIELLRPCDTSFCIWIASLILVKNSWNNNVKIYILIYQLDN